MARTAKLSRGSWCLGFGLETPPTLEQVARVLSAFGYDGIELAGFFDHATVERYPDKESRKKLVDWLGSLNLELVGLAPGPYGDFGRLPWATGSDDVLAEYKRFFDAHLQLCVDCGIPAMRVDPGDFGPLPRDADVGRAWDRVVSAFREHAEKGQEVGVQMQWEPETGQIFVRPSEMIQLIDDVGHPNLKIMYDVGHMEAAAVLAHNQLQPMERVEGGQVAFVKQLGNRIGHVHFCDSDSNTWHNAFGTHLGIGKGVLDMDALISALADVYEGEWWSVDAIPMTTETWTDTWDDKLKLDALLDKHVRNR